MDTGTAAALVVSVIATASAIYFSWAQRDYARRSLTPIASLPHADYEDRLEVLIRNKGLGPLIMKSFAVRNQTTSAESADLLSQMPDLPEGVYWSNYRRSFGTLAAGEAIELLALDVDTEDEEYCLARQQVRAALKDLSIRVEYTDLYGRNLPAVEQSLDWFGRNL